MIDSGLERGYGSLSGFLEKGLKATENALN